ncbi:MAG: DNA mismatch repair protein MutS [Magnetococcus sp. DMHC-6]
MTHITGLTRTYPDDTLILDDACRRNLEINVSLRTNQRKGSLGDLLDTAHTAMGGRLLRGWLNRPLRSCSLIQQRLAGVEWFLKHFQKRETVRQTLKKVHDLERLLGRIALKRASPRDLGALRDTLNCIPLVEQLFTDQKLPEILQQVLPSLSQHADLSVRLNQTLTDEPPIKLQDGNVIRPLFNPELDKLRTITEHGKEYLAELEQRERKKTGISSLKIVYHHSFGYTLQVTNTQRDKVPYHYIPKQTMVNAVRYVTEELKQEEETILNAEVNLTHMEAMLFEQLALEVSEHAASLQQTAHALAVLDVLTTFADTAHRRNYCQPYLEEGDTIDIRNGRHPVVEAFNDTPFVANDTLLNTTTNRIALITGPNMAGKSTLMRQVALIVLMAQMGSFVPASSAKIGLVDRIFTRIGAADDLAGGRSTFMVEMTEAAHILHHATPRSLVIFDEIGRGTSTLDGLAIARAVAEHIYSYNRSRTLFATHFHELTILEQLNPGIVNHTVEVKEVEEQILFLHTIIRGAADRSYGIHVAQLAGLPATVITRANAILADLESNAPQKKRPAKPNKTQTQLSLFLEHPPEPIVLELKHMNPDDLTPKQALELLYRLKKMV